LEEGLVRRSTYNMFHLTEYGMIVMKQIPDFMFMKENKKFFEDLSLSLSLVLSLTNSCKGLERYAIAKL
jgi:hypothetical protein